MIQSIFESKPDSWSLRIVTDQGVLRAWLRKEVMPTMVGIGQVWALTGEQVDLGIYGERFAISTLEPILPTGRLLVSFLCHHVPGLGLIAAQRWWTAFGDRLPNVLTNHDIHALAQAHGGRLATTVSRLSVALWAYQTAYVALARELHRYGFHESIIRKLLDHYGAHGKNKILEDPYRLLAFAGFHAVDSVATLHYAVLPNDPRRLLGAVEAGLHALHDIGITITTREKLGDAVSFTTGLDQHCISMAIGLAEIEGRIIALDEQNIIGEGSAYIRQQVLRSLTDRIRTSAYPNDDTRARIGNVPSFGLESALDLALTEPLSIVVARSEHSCLQFVQTLRQRLSADGETCHVLDGGKLATEIRSEFGADTETITAAADAGPSSFTNRSRTFLILSSTIDFINMAKVLPLFGESDRLVLIGKPLKFSGERMLLLPALLAIDNVCRATLNSEEPSLISAVREVLQPTNLETSSYDPRNPMRTGVFTVVVNDISFDQAVVGLHYQLARHSDTAVVVCDPYERRKIKELLSASQHVDKLGSSSVGRVVGADEIEPADSDTSIIALRDPAKHDIDWIDTAIESAKSRAILVIAREYRDARCKSTPSSAGPIDGTTEPSHQVRNMQFRSSK
ncbi:helix-hairpin-helix domain-containing protein [Paraburkholderia sediminicola]|uniref:helix-hairpin-helix domain-containing protein n=1 Tax=Paraburkholderia sediminicola TaxID=458836 RepID=UPI0038BE0468